MKRSDLSTATDTQLLLRFVEGRDQSAFAELVRRHAPMVRATIARVLRDSSDAEDAFQATIFALAKAADQLRDRAAVAGWLHQVARGCATEIHRGNVRWAQNVERMMERMTNSNSDTSPHSPTCIANDELERILDDELARLPARLHAAIVLCDLEGLSRERAARELGVGSSTVSERVAKARALLRNRLVRRGVTLTMAGLAGLSASAADTSKAMSAAYFADVTSKATLYASGSSAAHVGVSQIVVQTASKVLSAMTKAKLISMGLLALMVFGVMGSVAGLLGIQQGQAQAGTLYLEEFTDNSLNNWIPWREGRGTIGIVDGQLVFDPNSRSDLLFYPKGVEARDVSVRVTARVTEPGGGISVGVRQGPNWLNEGTGYALGAGYNPIFNGTIGVAVLATAQEGEEIYFPKADALSEQDVVLNLPFDVRNEFATMQLDVIGNTYRGWIWRDGDPMPDQPQFEFTDDSNLAPGVITLGVQNRVEGGGAGNSSVIFKSIRIADTSIVPEPTAATLGFLAFLFFALLLPRRRS